MPEWTQNAHPVEGIDGARLGQSVARLAGTGRMIQIAAQIRILGTLCASGSLMEVVGLAGLPEWASRLNGGNSTPITDEELEAFHPGVSH
jgi:hypothetical protein